MKTKKWKEKTIGWLQKREIVKFINISNPVTITCSNSAAIDRLIQSGIDCKYLYLFGNIPYSIKCFETNSSALKESFLFSDNDK